MKRSRGDCLIAILLVIAVVLVLMLVGWPNFDSRDHRDRHSLSIETLGAMERFAAGEDPMPGGDAAEEPAAAVLSTTVAPESAKEPAKDTAGVQEKPAAGLPKPAEDAAMWTEAQEKAWRDGGWADRHCTRGDPGGKLLSPAEAQEYAARVNALGFAWKISKDGKRLESAYSFGDFRAAMKIVDRIADMAEEEQHHPDFSVHYNRVAFEVWTHSAGGLTENDFVLAAKIGHLCATGGGKR